MTPDRILSKREAVALTGLSQRTLERLSDLRPVRISAGRVGYRETDLLAWIAARPVADGARHAVEA